MKSSQATQSEIFGLWGRVTKRAGGWTNGEVVTSYVTSPLPKQPLINSFLLLPGDGETPASGWTSEKFTEMDDLCLVKLQSCWWWVSSTKSHSGVSQKVHRFTLSFLPISTLPIRGTGGTDPLPESIQAWSFPFQNLCRLVGVEVMEEASTGATDDVDANKD